MKQQQQQYRATKACSDDITTVSSKSLGNGNPLRNWADRHHVDCVLRNIKLIPVMLSVAT